MNTYPRPVDCLRRALRISKTSGFIGTSRSLPLFVPVKSGLLVPSPLSPNRDEVARQAAFQFPTLSLPSASDEPAALQERPSAVALLPARDNDSVCYPTCTSLLS